MSDTYLSYPPLMNFELTTRCPLGCPQCYCGLEDTGDLDYERALWVLRDGAANGLSEVSLSGGETMLYPRLFDLIAACAACGVRSNVALSGWGIDGGTLRHLLACGVSRIYVSLNGSTEAINGQSRRGYALALNTLRLLKEARFPRVCVNFVVHNSNCGDFAQMVRLCEDFHVDQLIVMAAKPTSAKEMKTLPSPAQSMRLAQDIRAAQLSAKVRIGVEHCYSQLRAFLGRSWVMGNTNTGIGKGCIAGRYSAALNVEGAFTPCRHLNVAESFESIGAYWAHSKELARLRETNTTVGGACGHCALNAYCLACFASRSVTKNCDFYIS